MDALEQSTVASFTMAYLSVSDINSWLKLLALSIVLKYIHRIYYRTKYWPPGPPGLPVLGNIFQLPSFPWFKFTEWKAQYGPIVSLDLAGQPMVILNTVKAATDLLNHRSQIYSDRPRYIMAQEIMTGGLNFALISYGSLWRRMRRATHESFNVLAAGKYMPLQETESIHLISNFLLFPDNWDFHFRRSAASTVLCSVYGWDPVGSDRDVFVEKVNDLAHRLVHAALPGAYLVESFPLMKYLPSWMAAWKRKGLEFFAKDTQMFEDLISEVKERQITGNCRPCFASSLLESQNRFGFSDIETSWLAGSMFLAGSETTAAALSVFLLAMVSHPDVLQKAHAELDEVVGRDRLPVFGDFDNLPYIQALVKEVLRWRTVSPLGVPRCTTQNDWYEGYYIPKGSVVVANIWAMNHDPDTYPNPDEFRPSRFLDASGKLDPKLSQNTSLGQVAFGFGRRICSGLNLANQSLFINIACMLWAFDIEKATDAQGGVIVPSKTKILDEGIVVRPALFTCKVKPRSSDVVNIVEQAKAEKQC